MKRNIVILNGSPRRKGNTAALVAAFTQGAEAAGHQVTTFFLEELDLHGCRGCFGGHSSQPCPCVQKDDMADVIFELLGVTAADMSAFALSVSPMNIKAYGIAAIYPAAGKSDAVLEGLNAFIDRQKQSFEQYLADQYEIASNARLETLEDGTILLVMCEDQDAVFDAIRDTIEGAA